MKDIKQYLYRLLDPYDPKIIQYEIKRETPCYFYATRHGFILPEKAQSIRGSGADVTKIQKIEVFDPDKNNWRSRYARTIDDLSFCEHKNLASEIDNAVSKIKECAEMALLLDMMLLKNERD